MRDINFFAIYKKSKSENASVKIAIAIILAIVVLVNAGLVAVYFLTSNQINTEINDLKAKLGSESLLDQVAEANRLQLEVTLTKDYLTVLKNSSDRFNQMVSVDTALLDRIRSLIPSTTVFYLAEYNGNQIRLECSSSNVTDPLDIYHAFLEDQNFTSVTLSDILIDDNSNTAFSIFCQITGGELQ